MFLHSCPLLLFLLWILTVALPPSIGASKLLHYPFNQINAVVIRKLIKHLLPYPLPPHSSKSFNLSCQSCSPHSLHHSSSLWNVPPTADKYSCGQKFTYTCKEHVQYRPKVWTHLLIQRVFFIFMTMKIVDSH